MQECITRAIEEKRQLLDQLESCGYFEQVEKVGMLLVEKIKNGNKILLAGNGGSAADAQHFAGEIVGRFCFDRKSLPAISLCVDPSVMTCIANDYGYDDVFARQVEGLGKSGDALIVISTSGNSKNCINAIEVAKSNNITTIGYLGKDGGSMKDMCDYALVVPSNSTPRIQEIHTLTTHILCEMIERNVFGK